MAEPTEAVVARSRCARRYKRRGRPAGFLLPAADERLRSRVLDAEDRRGLLVGGGTVRREISGHIRSLRRYALVLTRDCADAEDLVQETLLRALSAAETFRPGAEMRSWLFRIMHNTHASAGRKAQTRAVYARQQTLAEPPTQPASQHDRLEVKAVIEALHRLPEAQREAVALIALEDMRYAEAAKVIGVPLGTFMSRIARGREALRQMVEGRNDALRAVGELA